MRAYESVMNFGYEIYELCKSFWPSYAEELLSQKKRIEPENIREEIL